jgi:hypothetical protein
MARRVSGLFAGYRTALDHHLAIVMPGCRMASEWFVSIRNPSESGTLQNQEWRSGLSGTFSMPLK